MNGIRFGALFVVVVAMVPLAGCSAPTPEKVCEKAPEKDRAECTKELTTIKGKLDEIDKNLWKDFTDCAAKESVMDEKVAKSCIGTETMKKIKK